MLDAHLANNATMRLSVLTMNQNATASSMDFVLSKIPISDQSYRLVGTSKQAFSDRRSPATGNKPWDPNQLDEVTLEVLASPGDLNFRFKFTTWNFEVTLRPTCERTMMYGWDGETYYVLKPMQGKFVPPPPGS